MKTTYLNVKSLKRKYLILLIFLLSGTVFSQQEPLKKYIFIPHPRNDVADIQGSIKAIELIDFTKFDMILLGGDLAYHTTVSRVSMDHLNSIYNLSNENTLWTIGNHDLANPNLITEYTGRPRHYAYNKDNITFLVLDTEIGSNAFASSHITEPQVEMIRNVIDTIANSRYLILLHHRLLWMIGDEYFKLKIDSVGESTRQLDTSNFNQIVFPLLQQAKKKGIQVICLGGDKSKINFQYSPEDSITYIASTMGPEFADSVNDVLILSHDLIKDSISWNYLPLSEVEKKAVVVVDHKHIQPDNPVIIYSDHQNQQLIIQIIDQAKTPINVLIFDTSGRNIKSFNLDQKTEKYSIPITNKGIFLVRLKMDNHIISKKIIF